MRALRGSQFMIPVEMMDTVASAEDREDWYGRYVEKAVGPTGRRRLAAEVVDVLRGRVLTAREIKAELTLEGDRAEAMKFIIHMLTVERRIATATVVGGWRSNQYRYALWEEWFPEHPPKVLDGDASRVDVANWYLTGHGPATVADFSWWSGFNKTNSRSALEDSEAVTVDTETGPMYDLPDRSEPETPRGVRLLPVWDTALVTQKERRRMVPDADQPYVYSRDGNLTSTVVSDGTVVGVWDRQGDDLSLVVKVAPLSGFEPEVWDGIEQEAAVVAAALGLETVEVVREDEPVNLLDASRNRFLSPLSGS